MLSRSGVCLTALTLMCSCLPCVAQQGKLLPVDDSGKSPSFKAFRNKLLEAIKARDADFLLDALDPDIKNSFGGNGGVAEFQEVWHPEDPESDVWEELEEILSLGVVLEGSVEKGYFSAPYVFQGFPDEYDAFDYGAVVRKDAVLRERPESNSAVVARLTYNIVKLVEWLPDAGQPECRTCGWYRIETLGGVTGYMSRRDARSPIDYRAIFHFRDGKWKMTAFVAGD